MTSEFLTQPLLSRRERLRQIFQQTEQFTVLQDGDDFDSYKRETPLVYTWQEVVNDIASGQIENPVGVYRALPGEPSENVSPAIAAAVLDKLIEAGEPLDRLCEFVTEHVEGLELIIAEARADREFEDSHRRAEMSRG